MNLQRSITSLAIRQVIAVMMVALLCLPVFSKHVLGGDLAYNWISGKKYKFKVHVYRNCSDCEFNTTGCADITELEIYLSPEISSVASLQGKIPLKRISKTDVSAVCNSVKTNCSGGTYSKGIEDWYFEGEFDFAVLSTTDCKFEIGLKIDSRLDAWNTGISESYYNFTRLNICNGIVNNSPVIGANPFYVLPLNQSFTYNPLASDQDKDSLVYSFVPAGKGFNRNITYGAGYTYDKPLDAYCPSGTCTLNTKTWPIEGIGVDQMSGWMGFTPTLNNATGFIVMQIAEYRKINGNWIQVGMVRRDLQYLVQDIQNYVPTLKLQKDTFFACLGEDFYLDVAVNDRILSSADSVSLKAWLADINGKISIAGGNGKNNYDALWTFKPDKSTSIGKPLYLTLIGTDNHCPATASTFKTVVLYVVEKPVASFTLTYKKCNIVDIGNASNAGTGKTEAWFILDSAMRMVDYLQGEQSQIKVNLPGKYYFKRQIRDEKTQCETEFIDSIVVPEFRLLESKADWPEKACNGDTLTLLAKFTGGTAPFVYYWNQISGNNSQQFKLSDSADIQLYVTDRNGCDLKISKTIKSWPYTGLSVTDTSRCLPLPGRAVHMNSRFSLASTPSDGPEMILRKGQGILTKSDGQYQFVPEIEGTSRFGIYYKDQYGCRYSDSFSVSFVKPPATGIGPIQPLCANSMPLNIRLASGCKIPGGQWMITPADPALQGDFFTAEKSGAGRWKLKFSAVFSGCTVTDSTDILVNKLPQTNILDGNNLNVCENTPDFSLNGIPAGGTWESAGQIVNSVVSPSALVSGGKKNHTFLYSFTEPATGCKNQDSIVIRISRLPSVWGLSDTSVCGASSLILKPSVSGSAGIQVISYQGAVQLKRMADDILITSDDVKEITDSKVNYVLLAEPGCLDQAVIQQIRVKPLPRLQLTGNPLEACVPFTSQLKLEALGSSPLPDQINWSHEPGAAYTLNKAVFMEFPGSRRITVNYRLMGCEGKPAEIRLTGRETPAASISVNPERKITTADFPYFTFRNNTVSADSQMLNWQFPGGRPSVGFLPRHDVFYPSDTGRYKIILTVKTKYGCTSRAETGVLVAPVFSMYVPTVFTPDGKGPGQNESFYITADSMPEFKLIVRNKWGEIVFKSLNLYEGWDGNYQGKAAPAGIYAWQIEGRNIYGRYIEKKGTVALIR